MTEKFSRVLFIVEAAVLAMPASVLVAMAVWTTTMGFEREFWPWIAMDIITGLAVIALVCGWWLLIRAIRGGALALAAAHQLWWLGALLGPALVAAAIGSILLPPSPEYSSAEIFRTHLQACVLGLPLVLVLAHAWSEARFRGRANNALQATCEDARA